MKTLFKRIFAWLPFEIGQDIFNAIKDANHEKINAILTQKPELISDKNKNEETAWDIARKEKHKEFIRILSKHEWETG